MPRSLPTAVARAAFMPTTRYATFQTGAHAGGWKTATPSGPAWSAGRVRREVNLAYRRARACTRRAMNTRAH